MFNLLDKLIMPIDEACRQTSIYAGKRPKDKPWKKYWKEIPWRITLRYRLWLMLQWDYLPNKFSRWKLKRLEKRIETKYGKDWTWDSKLLKDK